MALSAEGWLGSGLEDDRLRRLYERRPRVVAFVDESYRAFERPGEPPFYLMVATVIAGERLRVTRDVLMDIAGGSYWHTAEAFRLPAGREVIGQMVDYLSSTSTQVVTVEARIDPEDQELERARRFSFARLASVLASESFGVDLLVYEQRTRGVARQRDAETVSQFARGRPALRQLRVQASSPSREPLLWAPDVVAWSARRAVALGDQRWFEPLQRVTQVVLTRSGVVLDRLPVSRRGPGPAPGGEPGRAVK